MPIVLNVGGGSRSISIPDHYRGWTHRILDADPRVGADVVCDARLLAEKFDAGVYDAIYCSHNLEHYYPHDGRKVLRGFVHVLKPDGFAEIRVPDMAQVMRFAVENRLDIEDEIYRSAEGPIRVLDVFYGFQAEIARSGLDFYAHRTGFSAKSLQRSLREAGFGTIAFGPPLGKFELRAVAFKEVPTAPQRALLGMAR